MNKYIGIGNICKDIDLKKTTNGTSVASFSIAINGYNNSVEYVNCVTYQKQADNLAQYCGKGSKVCVEGRLQTRNYEGKNGKVYVTEVIVNNIEFLSTKDSGQTNNQEPTKFKSVQQQADDFFDNNSGLEINSDDLPF